MREWMRDIRSTGRQLIKSPGFSVGVVLTLALGIGATTAIFSLVEAVLLRPLPFKDPARLVVLGDHVGNSRGLGVTAREIETYSKATSAFSALGGYSGASYELSGRATPDEIAAARFTAGVFPTLGVQPILGRVFTQQEEDAHKQLAVISYGLWRERFQSDSKVLGSVIYLDRKAYSIIGVMPRGFEFPMQPGLLDHPQLWVPVSLMPDELTDENAGNWRYQMIGRLRSGVSQTQAAQDTDRVAKQIMRDFPPNMAAIHIQGDVKPLRDFVVADVEPTLRTLFLAVTAVLLLACVNVAGLMLVRAIRRRREYAVRLALGARASTILLASAFEGLLLSLLGGLLGLALAAVAIRTTLHLLPDSIPRLDSVGVNGATLLFALALSLITGTLCSLAPAFAAMRTSVTESLKEGAGTGGASLGWLRSGLVVFEIAIAVVLMTVAGAFLRSFENMSAVDPGFRTDHVLVAGYQLPLTHYPNTAAVRTFNHALLDRLTAQPGTIAAGLTNVLPGSGAWAGAAYPVEGILPSAWHLQFADFSAISGDFFKAMGIRVLEGRTFNEDDRIDTLPVVIVNQRMASHLWPNQSPIGKRIHVGNPKRTYPWATVVGVVADTKLGSRDEPGADQWYFPAEQPTTLFGPESPDGLTSAANEFITLRSAVPPERLTQTLRNTVASIDPLLALQQVQPMSDVISNVEAPRRFNTGLISAFALGALLLAITGTYAVVAFSVSLRGQEMAIRMAVGAQRGAIARLVLASGLRLALLGSALGILGSIAASRLVASFLFGVTATDPLVFTAGIALMVLMVLLASALPALRASKTDPVTALRSV